MADTVGQLIDKLFTVDTKMWNAQEDIYQIRRMSFDEFKKAYSGDDEKLRKLHTTLKKACDLNVQRNDLITEIDRELLKLIAVAVAGADLSNYPKDQHKTY